MWWRAVGLVVLACSLQVCLDYLGTVSGRAPDRSRDWDPMSAPSDRERNCPKWLSLLRCAVVLPFVCAPLRAPWCCLNSTCKRGRTRWPRFACIRGTTPMRRAPLPSCPMRRVHAGAHVLAGGILCGDVQWRCPACLGQRAIHGARVLGAPLVCRCVRFCKRIAIEQRRCVDAVRTAPALVRAACVPLRSLSVWPYAQGGRPAGGRIRTDRALTLTRPLRSQRTRLLRIAAVKSARRALPCAPPLPNRALYGALKRCSFHRSRWRAPLC